MGVSEAFSKFCTPVFSKIGVQKTKNAPETPNLIIYTGRKQVLKGSEGYKNPGKAKLRPNHVLVRDPDLTELSRCMTTPHSNPLFSRSQ